MVIFHSYVSLPECSWLVVSNMAYIPPIVCGISMNIPYDWLLVWNMFFFSHHIGNVIIPTDELHDFSEG
jgi:hypothetical protein